jgi:hypothetical protein
MDEVIPLGGELSCRSGHISNLEFDTGLGDGSTSRPFGGSEAGIRRLRKGPETEVFCPFQLVREHVVALSSLETKPQGVRVEGSRGLGISHNRGNARYELDIHQPAPPQ